MSEPRCRDCGKTSGPFRWIWKADDTGALQRHQAVCWSHRGEAPRYAGPVPFRSFRSGYCDACGMTIAAGDWILKIGDCHYHEECGQEAPSSALRAPETDEPYTAPPPRLRTRYRGSQRA